MPTNAQNAKIETIQTAVERSVATEYQKQEGTNLRVIGKRRSGQLTSFLYSQKEGYYKRCYVELVRAVQVEQVAKYYTQGTTNLKMRNLSSVLGRIRSAMLYRAYVPTITVCLTLFLFMTSMKEIASGALYDNFVSGSIRDYWWFMVISPLYLACFCLLLLCVQYGVELVVELRGKVRSTKVGFLGCVTLLAQVIGVATSVGLLNLRLIYPKTEQSSQDMDKLRSDLSNGFIVAAPFITSLCLGGILLSILTFIIASREDVSASRFGKLARLTRFCMYEAAVFATVGSSLVFTILLAKKMTTTDAYNWIIVFIPLLLLDAFIGLAALIPMYQAMVIYRCRKQRETIIFAALAITLLVSVTLTVLFQILVAVHVPLGVAILTLLPVPTLAAASFYLYSNRPRI
jgi:hypothetical protein